MSVGYYERKIPQWLRAIGCFDLERTGARFRWGEFSRKWGLSLELCLFGDSPHWSLKVIPVYGQWFINLGRAHREPKEMMESWGFTFSPDAEMSWLRLHWGDWSKGFDPPLRWKHHSTEILLKDGTWRPRKSVSLGSGDDYDTARAPLADVHTETHEYHYMLDNGEVQHVDAKVTVERSTRRRIKWLPWPSKVVRAIDIWFSEEVGARRGSWKGGCVGCGYEMRHGETPRDTLKRMQRERRFR